MGITENHTLFCEASDGGSGDFSTLRVEALDVAVSEVITEDKDDVGFLRSRKKSLSEDEGTQDGFHQFGFHVGGTIELHALDPAD